MQVCCRVVLVYRVGVWNICELPTDEYQRRYLVSRACAQRECCSMTPRSQLGTTLRRACIDEPQSLGAQGELIHGQLRGASKHIARH